MRPPIVPAFRTPAPPRFSAWAFAAGVAFNIVIVGAAVISQRSGNEDVLAGLAALMDDTREIQVVEMVYLLPLDTVIDAGGALEVAGGVEEEFPEEELLPELPQDEEEGIVEEEVVEEEEPVPLVEAVPTEAPRELSDVVAETILDSEQQPVVIGRRRRLGPAYGDGRVWAPISLTPGERAVLAVSVAAIDSLARERILAAIREIPPDSFAMAMGPSGWMTQIGGQDFGIDQQFITLGPLKVPTFLLAFLPMGLPEGNIFDMKEKQRYEQVRQQIIRQAQTMADREQVKDYIEQMRERIDEERLRRMTDRDSSVVARRDSIIPNR